MINNFFIEGLPSGDKDVSLLIEQELVRQKNQIELIASENIVSKAVLEAQGSILTNKYAEGYPGKRYYGGCEFVDQIEIICQDRIKKLYDCTFANVQPHSGSQANQAVFLSLLSQGDKILGMSLDAGGHLTHGSKVNMSGKWFEAISYGLEKETNLINMNEVEEMAKKYNPKLIIAGASAYSRTIDFKAFKEIADSIGAYLLADVSHYSGLIVAGQYPSPFPYADIVTSTTHKTLRGPRGAVILTNKEDLYKKLNSAVFPGMQGGPLMHVIAAKAVAFKEALSAEFKEYAINMLGNARVLASTLLARGIDVVSGGTDSHMLLVDLRSKGISGKDLEHNMEKSGLTCNKNTVPSDPRGPFVTSGIRLGSPAATTRGLGSKEFERVGNMIADLIEVTQNNEFELGKLIATTKREVEDICKKFPIY